MGDTYRRNLTGHACTEVLNEAEEEIRREWIDLSGGSGLSGHPGLGALWNSGMTNDLRFDVIRVFDEFIAG